MRAASGGDVAVSLEFLIREREPHDEASGSISLWKSVHLRAGKICPAAGVVSGAPPPPACPLAIAAARGLLAARTRATCAAFSGALASHAARLPAACARGAVWGQHRRRCASSGGGNGTHRRARTPRACSPSPTESETRTTTPYAASPQ